MAAIGTSQQREDPAAIQPQHWGRWTHCRWRGASTTLPLPGATSCPWPWWVLRLPSQPPSPAEEVGCGCFDNRKQKQLVFFSPGEHGNGAPGAAGGGRAMPGFGGRDKPWRRDSADNQSSLLTEHISCLTQPGRPSPRYAFMPTSTLLTEAASEPEETGEVTGRRVGGFPPKFRVEDFSPCLNHKHRQAGLEQKDSRSDVL